MMDVVTLDDVYPSGDEVVLVHGLTGRRPPPGGFPTEVGVLVQNDETLLNISRAMDDEPVTETWLTVCGAVAEPFTTAAPIGMSVGELLSRAGGFHKDAGDWVAMEGGAMMGRPVTDPSHPVSRTTAALLFLPRDHRVIRFATRSAEQAVAINRAACDQCSYCTQFCPRYLLGYAVEPHRVMRAAGFSARRHRDFDPYGRLCCECGICDLYACPEDLSPRDACRATKRRAGEHGPAAELPQDRGEAHPMRGARQVPTSMLKKRLDLNRYDRATPFRELVPAPETVSVPHRQHVGAPPGIQAHAGQKVGKGDVLTDVEPAELGVPVHAPFDGQVRQVTATATEIERGLFGLPRLDD
jgi:Na+-translocating ferredoxin:NAD+ oxidoreductase RnfC subunit